MEIRCTEPATAAWLAGNFSAFDRPVNDPVVRYRIEGSRMGPFRLARPPIDAGGGDWPAESGETSARKSITTDVTPRTLGGLVYELEADLVVQLQRLRTDLVFLHAAALESSGAVHLLVGRSGAGKSTTCWGLLHHGVRYLSDELAPVDPVTLRVGRYPHALCMKRDPPDTHPVPAEALRSDRGVHVPISDARLCPEESERTLASIVLLEYEAKAPSPVWHDIGKAEAAARIYPQFLNALVHPNDGLEAVARLVESTPVRRLTTAELTATCEAVVQAWR